MPSLTVKATAEMLKLPAHAQARILVEQKYPKKGTQVFRTPYYKAALNGISSYFRNDNNTSKIALARSKIKNLNPESKRINNNRVLDHFQKSKLAKRKLELITNSRISAEVNTVEFRLSADFRALEDEQIIVLYTNCRAHVLDPEVARLTLEIAHWVMVQQGDNLKLSQFEYFDLFSNVSYVFNKRRIKTIQALEQNAKIIEALWPTL